MRKTDGKSYRLTARLDIRHIFHCQSDGIASASYQISCQNFESRILHSNDISRYCIVQKMTMERFNKSQQRNTKSYVKEDKSYERDTW